MHARTQQTTAMQPATNDQSVAAAMAHLLVDSLLPRPASPQAAALGPSVFQPEWRYRPATPRGQTISLQAPTYIPVVNLKGKPLANLYVGTEETATGDQLLEKLARARKIRTNYLATTGGHKRMAAL